VTFRQVDPLFAIDLSDPAHPVSAGELIVPGYSTYLYAIDRDHLIGIGAGQDPSNPTWYHTLQISLYDVSDLANPIQVDQRLYTGGAVSSAAQYDPHAFSYFADQGVLAIPKTGGASADLTDLVLLKVNPTTGFTDLGEVVNNSPVQESLRIGDNLYSVGSGDIKIVKLLNPSHVVSDVTLPGTIPISLDNPIGIVLLLGGINILPIGVIIGGGGLVTAPIELGTLQGGALTLNNTVVTNASSGTLTLSGALTLIG
jgi:uncharacterized secreted protein with C-terminal beta-propeller domain